MAQERREALELTHHIVPDAAKDRRRVSFNGDDCTIFGYFATRAKRTMFITLKRLKDNVLLETELKLPKGYRYTGGDDSTPE